MTDYIIETKGLTVYYGRHRGIEDVDLCVERGEIFGFLGPNGAGKTTTQRVLMDIIRPTAGEARMLGMDCRRDGVAIRDRVGYLPGDLALYGSMKASDYFKMYFALQKSNGDGNFWRTLAERLDLDTSRKIREYSRGNKQKVGVISAFMNKPELLILDEPTIGLDPLVQQAVMELVREARDAGATVFFSSHILPEVQAVCDRVGIIREGRLVAVEAVQNLVTQQFKRLRLTLATEPPADIFAIEGVTELARDESGVLLEIRDNLNAALAKAVQFEIVNLESESVSLEDVFLAYYGRGNGGNHA